jgi:aldehyde dehydrogenase (NAD+)
MTVEPTVQTEFAPATLFVGGEDREHVSGEWFETRDPASGRPIARVARCGPEDVDVAVRDAQRAYPGWAAALPPERGRVLLRIANALLERIDELTRMETLDNGKPWSQARGDVEVAARYFEFYAGLADKIHGETIPLGPDYHSYTLRAPFGVTGHIIPWNAPLQQAARGLAPALVAGNTAVAKPAEDTPLSCLALARIAAEVGLPPGVLNVVPGFGPEAGAPLASHPLVRKVAFTGSVETGQVVMRAAADRLIPVTLELGGKSPNIVFADADLEAAARSSWTAITLNAGQTCSAGSRLLAHSSIRDELVERLVQRAAEASLGPGIDDPDIGAITTAEQFERVKEYLEIGRQEGVEVVAGGHAAEEGDLRNGHFIEPTIFTGVDNSMRIAQEEIFGPVLSVISFDTDEEAVQIANDTTYGLVAGLWTRDLSRAHRIARVLEAGQIYINQWYAGGVETPFGGSKSSGIGREKGVEAVSHYTETKTVTVRL